LAWSAILIKCLGIASASTSQQEQDVSIMGLDSQLEVTGKMSLDRHGTHYNFGRSALSSRLLVRFWGYAGVLLFVCFFSGVSLAEGPGTRYALGPLDVIRLKAYEWRAARDEVFEWKALNDEFAIGPEGTLSLPFVGVVTASGLNVAELGKRIAEQMKQKMGFIEAPSVSVEVAKFRPIYIVGDVHSPGEFPYRPGLTVLQALALSGGFYRNNLSGRHFGRETISVSGELHLVKIELVQYLAKRARLEAELRGDSEINFPVDLVQHNSKVSISQLLRQEELIFKTRLSAFDTEVKALQELRSFLRSSIKSIEALVETQDRQLALARKEFKSISMLAKKGLATASRSLGLQRHLAQLEGDRLKVLNSQREAQQELSKTELAIIGLRNKRVKDITAELSDTQAKIDALVQRYEMNDQLLQESAIGYSRSRRQRAKVQPSFFIVRATAAGSEELLAYEDTAVQPGDTVKVRRPVPFNDEALPETLIRPSASLEGSALVYSSPQNPQE
jgi:polysaccharide biosynthesis/export protein